MDLTEKSIELGEIVITMPGELSGNGQKLTAKFLLLRIEWGDLSGNGQKVPKVHHRLTSYQVLFPILSFGRQKVHKESYLKQCIGLGIDGEGFKVFEREDYRIAKWGLEMESGVE